MAPRKHLSGVRSSKATPTRGPELGDRLTVDLPVACAALGIGRTLGYELVRRGEFPVRVVRMGRRVVVSVHEICTFLGIQLEEGEIVTAERLEALVSQHGRPDPAA